MPDIVRTLQHLVEAKPLTSTAALLAIILYLRLMLSPPRRD